MERQRLTTWVPRPEAQRQEPELLRGPVRELAQARPFRRMRRFRQCLRCARNLVTNVTRISDDCLSFNV